MVTVFNIGTGFRLLYEINSLSSKINILDFIRRIHSEVLNESSISFRQRIRCNISTPFPFAIYVPSFYIVLSSRGCEKVTPDTSAQTLPFLKTPKIK